MLPKLDHVVVDVRDRMEEAAETFRSLGFQLTGRGRHTLGSINHLAILGSNYIELLGMDAQAPAPRADLVQFPVGLNGLVFATDQTESLFHDLQARGIPVEEPIDFSRPVNLAHGVEHAKFQVVRLRAGAAQFGRVYFCHHLTRDLVWRPEWRVHENGAIDIAGVVIVARDPAASTSIFGKMFGENAVHPGTQGNWILEAGKVRIEVLGPEKLAGRFGDVVPDPAGRLDYMAVLRIRTASVSQTSDVLQSRGIEFIKVARDRVLVPAAKVMNVAIEFAE